MGLKDIYYSLEEKYYRVLDRLNESIPVYTIIDPIDKIIPSFALLLVLVVLLAAGGLFFVLNIQVLPSESSVTFIVKNNEGRALENTKIFISGPALEFEKEVTTNKSGRATVTVPFGAELTVKANKRNYEEETLNVTADQEELEVPVFLEETVVPPSPHTISFAAPNGTKLDSQTVEAHFECTNSFVIPSQPDRTTSEGEITITPPIGCGLLTVMATSAGFKVLEEVIDLPAKLLTFEALPLPKGEVLFFIKDFETNQSLNGIKVSIFDATDFPQTHPKFSDRGEVSFSLEPGEYRAVVEDEDGEYPTEEVFFTISANETVTQNVFLTKKAAAILKISVKDKDSKARVDGARIVLRKESGEIVGEREISSEEPQAIFTLKERGIYYYIAGHEDYLSGEEIEIDLSDAAPETVFELEFELEQCTPQRCGVLNVLVVDEDEEPVENAAVYLYNAQTNSIALEFEQRVTDFEGRVEPYLNVGEKEFYAVAQKYPSTGQSETIVVDPFEINELTVVMEIGTGKIEIHAVDAQEADIAFAQAQIKASNGQTLATIALDAKGKGVFETKADKQVFVVVSKEGYTKYTSVLHQVFKDDRIKIKAELLLELTNEEIEAKFLGIFDPKGNQVTDLLTAGNTYIAKIQLLVPRDYKSAGLHFRVGKESLLSSDKLFIKSFNAPLTTAVAGKSFTPPLGEQADLQNIAAGDSKWVNVVWSQPSPGIYNTEFEIVIRPQTTMGAELPIHYRSWGVNESDQFIRHPQDNVLGTAKDAPAKQGLYAEVFTQNFFEGSQKICDESFCYSERVFDQKEGLILSQTPYGVRVFDDYKLSFEITNNSGTIFDEADLRIKNTLDGVTIDDTISIENYSITNADSVEFSSQEPTFALENPLDTGYFAPFRSINGEMTLQAKKIENSDIELKIVSGAPAGVEVFNKKIRFEPVAGQQIGIKVEPEVLGALIPIDLQIEVTLSGGKDDGKPLSGAKVIVKRIDPLFNETTKEATTDSSGRTLVPICAGAGCSPGTKIIVEVEKPGVAPNSVEKEVTDSIVEFNPEQLEFNLDLTDATAEQVALEILNLIPSTLQIKRIVLGGSFDGVLDIDRMAAYLQQYVGITKIEFNETKKINVLAAINNDARFLEESVSPTGSILIDLSDIEGRFTWPAKEIPMKVNVNLAQPPREENCLAISVKEWKDSVLETSATKEFTISNNCVSKSGAPLDLRNLQATIDWKSEEVTGQVMLTISNPRTGESVSQVLQQGLWTIFMTDVAGLDEFIATLTFVPKPSKIGKEAVFDVKIDAEQLTSSGQQFVGASNDISAHLLIVNLSGCIQTTPAFEQAVDMGTGDKATFSLSTESCGEIPIDIRFCHNDSGCKGGSLEGGIGVSPKEFSNLVAEEVEVQVRRESIPGIYGVGVEARPRGGGWREIGEVLVELDPKEGEAFELSKYDFVIIGIGAKDSATLTNSELAEEVQVDASDCDWGTAEEEDDSTFSLPGAGAGAAIGALMGAGPAIEAAKQASQAASAARVGTQVSAGDGLDSAITDTQGALNNLEGIEDSALDEAKSELGGPVAEQVEACQAAAEAMEIPAEIPIEELNESFGLTEENLTDSINEGTQSIDHLDEGQNNYFDAGKSLNGEGSQLSSNTRNAADSLKSAKANSSSGAASVGNAIASMTQGLANIAKQVTAAQAVAAEMTGIIATAQAMAAADPFLEEAAQLVAAECGKAITAVEAFESQNLADLKDVFGEGQEILESAKETIDKATESLDKSAQELDKLSTEQDPTSQAQDGEKPDGSKLDTFDEGTFLALESFYTALGFLAGGLLPGLFDSGDDPCDERTTMNVVDYIMNLVWDALGIDLDNEKIGGQWSRFEAKSYGEFEKQDIGVVFENLGLEEPRPVYSTASFSALKHIHANPTIIPRGQGNFGPFRVPDAMVQIYTQKFHLRFKTSEMEQAIPPVTAGTASCVSGVNIGRSGEGANPNVRFDWNWKDFSLGSCDVSNPDAIYCDATQFSFEVNYRLDALSEWLNKNREKLSCPLNPADDLAHRLVKGIPEQIASGELPSAALDGKVALVTYTFNSTEDSLTVNVVVGNSSESAQSASVVVDLVPPQGIGVAADSCQIEFSGIQAGGTQTKSCTFSSLTESADDYTATIEIVNASTDFEDKSLEFRTQIRSYIDCWVPASTELWDGRPAIDYFIEPVEGAIEWTERIPNRQALMDLLVFEAYLIKDGYSPDFLQDFVDYSGEVILFDAPSFFKDGFDAYYKNNAISFRKKYTEGYAQLARGGIYRTELLINWGGDWQFFDSQGKPFASVEVLLQLLQEPSPNNPFYHIPFDGLVGQVGENSLERQGYGTGFLNEREENIVSLNSSPPIAKTFSSRGSNAIVTASVEFEDDLFALNVNPVTRGNILSIQNTGTDAVIKFFPSRATPVMMKMHSKQTENPFGAYYGILINDNRTNIGEVLTYWSGAGACLDFSGVNVSEMFDDTPDRSATAEDGIQNWENNYTTQWGEAIKSGDVYLKTIFYTNPNSVNDLVAEHPEQDLEFLTPDEGPQKRVSLKGISDMQFNSVADGIETIEDVFALVEEGTLCTTNTGNSVSFWWNPKEIYEQEGSRSCLNCDGFRSIEKESFALQASQTCIGSS